MKPCPFCASEDLNIVEYDYGGYRVVCENCEARGPNTRTYLLSDGGREEVIKAWDRRKPDE